MLTLENIIKNNSSSALNDREVPNLLNDFCRREILIERGRRYDFVLPLFGRWLVQAGLNRLIADTLGDELAAEAKAADDEAFVSINEVNNLVGNWSLYQGREVTVDKVRLWLGQLKSIRQQRLLFTILQNVRFFTEAEIRELLRTAHSMVLPDLPLFVRRKASDVRSDVAVTYIDGEGKSGQYYAARYAEINKIAQSSVFSAGRFAEFMQLRRETGIQTSSIIIIDDIVATGRSIAGNLATFIEEHRNTIEQGRLPIFVVALCATVEGEQYLRSAIQKLDVSRIELRVCEILPRRHQAFHKESGIWNSPNDEDEAKALCSQIGSRIYRRSPLGFGQVGLLVVFPSTVPNNSLPILHSASRSGDSWTPLLPRLVN